ncbi:hypothetical protein [Levilactobacillus brevis]|jgi:hypothetical protein|uniref:hypothetical protein n=1 Tax=Levilactobacillus brevis TaxID=1580 RepID=UPI0021A578BF|nr:hypothetical protein [Levilactobacillus brevis]MCT3569250.1 hypothetical protein [Levilactobacillus brevis]MCT3577768.1 hypothetical protein [Levilactobacillus brevis]MCX7511766.1 hypothetical protein [Levilactobacillus brevis]
MPILKKSGKLLNIVLAVSILVLGIFVVALGNVKASADETSQEAAVGENFVNSFNDNKFTLSDSSITTKVNSWGNKNSNTLKDAQNYSNTRSDNVSISKDATVKTLNDKSGDTYYVAYYDVAGPNIKQGSYLSLFYKTNGQLINTSMVMGVSSSVGVNTYIYGNGKQTFAATIDEDGNVLSSSTNPSTNFATKEGNGMHLMAAAKKKKKKKTKKSWLSCMGKCLNGMGIPNWVLGAVGAGCAVVCIGTAGTGCAACVSAVGAGYGTEVFHCAHYKC